MEAVGRYSAPKHGWTCFHCGETFTDKGSAAEHFGPTPQWEPACVDGARNGDGELLKRARSAERDAEALAARATRAEEEEEYAIGQLSSLGRHFPGAVSVYEAWCQFHVMEGRALAAEAILAEVQQRAPEIILAAAVEVCGPGEYDFRRPSNYQGAPSPPEPAPYSPGTASTPTVE